MADIFVSYSSEDRDRIKPLIELLENQGWSVWWDRELIVGPAFAEKIQENVDAAKCVIVVWSLTSINSNWCRDEANEGLERKCLVPLRIDDVRPPLGFRSLQTASLLGWPRANGDSEQLIAGVRECLELQIGTPKGTVSPPQPTTMERSVAVLPFSNLSSDPEQEYFCDGLVEDITTELSHIPQLEVISRNSSFAYKGSSAGVRHVARDLDVNFVLQGSVRRSGDRARVSAVLVEAASGKTLWSRKYDRAIADVFALQDELTGEIVTALDVELISGETGRLRRKAYRSAEAGEVLYKGMFEHYKYERSSNLVARQRFEEFVRLEPHSVLGYSWLVTTWAFALVVGWEAPEAALQQLRKWVDSSLAIDADDPHALVGDTYFRVLTGDLDEGLRSVEMAIGNSPSLDEAWFARGWLLMLLGDANQSIENVKRAMRLCPIPPPVRLEMLGTAYRNAARYDEAIQTFEDCLRRYPDFIYAHASLAVVHGMMGDDEAAAREVQKTMEMDHTYTVERFVTPNLYRDRTVMDRCADALRQAGMPEK